MEFVAPSNSSILELECLDQELDNESFEHHAIWSVNTILSELIFLWGGGEGMVVSVHSYKIPLILTKQCSVGPPFILSLLVCVIKFWNWQLLDFFIIYWGHIENTIQLMKFARTLLIVAITFM